MKKGRKLRVLAFWLFQIVNTVTGVLMTFFPKDFHESLFQNPQLVYEKLGFSTVAVEMIHNVIRGHGAVLLAVSIFIWMQGTKSRAVYLLIFIVSALSVYAHIMTLIQHLASPEIVSAIGDFGSLYAITAVTAAVGLISLAAYLRSAQKEFLPDRPLFRR